MNKQAFIILGFTRINTIVRANTMYLGVTYHYMFKLVYNTNYNSSNSTNLVKVVISLKGNFTTITPIART